MEDYLPTPVTLTSLPEKREMAATGLEIINNTGSAVKDQSVNMVNSLPPTDVVVTDHIQLMIFTFAKNSLWDPATNRGVVW